MDSSRKKYLNIYLFLFVIFSKHGFVQTYAQMKNRVVRDIGMATIPRLTTPACRVRTAPEIKMQQLLPAIAPLAALPNPIPRKTESPHANIADAHPVTLFASFNLLYRSSSA
ncbi:hypothetical protein GCK72_012759 [Caenorhabditis remanei]|uniref:Uncharacterized protein n=1 Tax=Caenorhabditis remanei TaxID=31234 RepID=A0A6A5GP80_CAERE|nr:hypothetical protein GCK72_012759 [Caenorhabditis remanei]KAF1756306.1 hypothetical protein GCK72_012759 [Caenorhabditis remanei]